MEICTMADNPLERYFRRPALWIRLPSGGRWYRNREVVLNDRQEVRIFGLTAIDDIMLNTPDALFNGYALESVITSCVPDVKDVKRLLQPDLDAIFLGIKSATNRGKFEIERKCAKCGHENNFEVQCNHLLDGMTYIEDSETKINIDGNMRVNVKPYDFEQRSMLLQKQLEEQQTINAIELDETTNDEFTRAGLLAKSIEKLSQLTFKLLANSITSIEILGEDAQTVTDKDHIAEWLTNIDMNTAETITEAVNNLNVVGPPKKTLAKCEACGNEWDEELSFDPALFFSRRYRPQTTT
jgi:hypothetical protein